MRAKLFLIMLSCAAWTACQGNGGADDAHDDSQGAETAAVHDHEGHDHEAEGHDHATHDHEGHDHEGHSHEAESHDGHNHEAEEHDHSGEEAAHAEAASGEISLPAAKAAAAGVEVQTVSAGPFRDVIVASGRVMPAPGDETAVVASVSGVVSFSRPLVEGAQVAKGASMFTISSERIQEGDAVERARIAYKTARAEYERARSLVGDRIVSQKDYEAAAERYETARLAYEAVAREDGEGGTVVEAPAAGYVKSCAVKEGDYVSVGMPLAVVTQNRRLNLRVDVPERYYSKLGSVATANFRAASGERIHRLADMHGRMVAYGRNADDASAYIPVTFSFDNAADVVAGSFAEVWLLAAEREGVLSLPVEALTEEQGVYFVYVQLDEDCYRKQAVTVGASDGERVEITSGLKDGERVVTRGAIHVKLASASNAIPAHTHNH